MPETTSKYEAVDAQIQQIYNTVSNPENLSVRFPYTGTSFDFVISYECVKYDHSGEYLIRDYNFMIHPDSYDSDTVTVYNMY